MRERERVKMLPILNEAIVNIVNANGGINGVNLVMKVMNDVNPQKFNHKLYMEAVNGLVASGEIVELEYILPDMDYRVKSMYFKKGTRFGRPTVDPASNSDIHMSHNQA